MGFTHGWMRTRPKAVKRSLNNKVPRAMPVGIYLSSCLMCRSPIPSKNFLKRGASGMNLYLLPPRSKMVRERSHHTDDEGFYNRKGFMKPEKRRRNLAHYVDYWQLASSSSPGLEDIAGEIEVFPWVPECYSVFEKSYYVWRLHKHPPKTKVQRGPSNLVKVLIVKGALIMSGSGLWARFSRRR